MKVEKNTLKKEMKENKHKKKIITPRKEEEAGRQDGANTRTIKDEKEGKKN